MSVILETSVGNVVVDLYTSERPICTKNFLKLCKIKYFNFCLFHSVQRNLSAQTGDPTGSGTSGESIYGKMYGDQAKFFEAEQKPIIKHKKRGCLSMVNNGSNMHGSQFFITLASDLDYLDGIHTVFGEVAEDEDQVLDKINEAYCDDKNRPYRDIRILHTIILEDPFDDPDGLSRLIPAKSPIPTKEQLETVKIGIDDEIDDTKGKTEEEINEMIESREAKANAQILEMIGDIPDEEVKPPDNVLFVCKLNPVTTDDDLEVIFSRFGKIESCEIIRDDHTGESLQYAFIEYEKPEDCENAYFKMDNVLIDDRRIHVDFSQSVAKLKPSSEKGGRVHLKIKDTSKKDNYEYVFSDDETPNKKEFSTKTVEKEKNYKEKTQSNRNNKNRSRSPERKHSKDKRKHSPDRNYHRNRKRSHEDKRNHSPDRYTRDKARRQSPRHYRRSRSKSRDRHERKHESRRYDFKDKEKTRRDRKSSDRLVEKRRR